MAKRVESQGALFAPTSRVDNALSVPRSAVVSQTANRSRDKAKVFGEINPFDPKVNVIVLNGDVVPDVAAAHVPGLKIKRKVAAVPGRIVTVPVPEHLEGDSYNPEEDDDNLIGGDADGSPLRNSVTKFFSSAFAPRKSTPKSVDRRDSDSNSVASSDDANNQNANGEQSTAVTAPGSRFWHLGGRLSRGSKSKQKPNPAEAKAHADDAADENQGGGKELRITIADSHYGNFEEFGAPVQTQLGQSLYSKIQGAKANPNSLGESKGEDDPNLTPLQRQAHMYLDQLEPLFASLFQLYAWANLSERERLAPTVEEPKISYLEAVQQLRKLYTWTDLGSKRKFQALSKEDKLTLQQVYMKLLSILMVHGALTTGCEMTDVMQWHGNHLGYKIGKHVWNMAELQYCVDAAL